KQPGAFFVLYALLGLLRRGKRTPSKTVTDLLVFLAGALAPFALACLLLFTAGVFQTFWFWTVTYASKYAAQMTIAEGWLALKNIFIPRIARPVAVWVAAGLGLTVLIVDHRMRKRSRFVMGFLLFSFLSVCSGFYFRPHYFVLMLPAVSLLAGVLVTSATSALCQSRISPQLPVIVSLLFLAIYIWGQRKLFWKVGPLEASRIEYPGEPYTQAPIMADSIRTLVPSTEPIAVLGSEPEIYFYSHRRSATTYIYTHPFSEAQPYAAF